MEGHRIISGKEARMTVWSHQLKKRSVANCAKSSRHQRRGKKKEEPEQADVKEHECRPLGDGRTIDAVEPRLIHCDHPS